MILFGMARPTVSKPNQIFSYNSLSAAIHLYMIRAWPTTLKRLGQAIESFKNVENSSKSIPNVPDIKIDIFF